MENQNRVQLTTTSVFKLEKEELKRLYVYLSLFQYHYLRYPDYSEYGLLANLEKDFKAFTHEMQNQLKKDPNNLTLSKMNSFIGKHYSTLKHIVEEINEDND